MHFYEYFKIKYFVKWTLLTVIHEHKSNDTDN